jgi:hypothetical protein
VFSPTALGTSDVGTISTTKDRRAGLSKATVTPPIAASTYTATTGGDPVNASAARAKDCSIATDWTASSRRRLSERSATNPAHGPSSRTGPNWAAASTPSATPEPVRR